MPRLSTALVTMCFLLMGHASSMALADDAKPTVTEPRTQTLKGFVYFYGSTRTNFQNLADKLKVLIPDVQKGIGDAHAAVAGPMVIIYHGVTEAPGAEFDVQVGYPIAARVEGLRDFKVREVAEYPCMGLLFSGKLSQLESAFEKLMPAAMGAGKATDETREMYLYWEGMESPNNVVHVSVGMKN